MLETLGLIALGVAAAATGNGRVGHTVRTMLDSLMGATKGVPAPNHTHAHRPRPQYQSSEWDPYWFHGTPKIEWAKDILRTHRWWVNASHGNPVGIYLTPEFDEAKEYAKEKGAIIVASVDERVGLVKLSSDQNNDYHYIPVNEKRAFYVVEGVTPLMALSKNAYKLNI